MKSGSEILNELLQKEGINPNQLAAKMKLNRTQAIYDILNNKIKKISDNHADKILKEYPYYNKVWLLTGEGDMLKGNNTQQIKDISDNRGFIGQMHGGNNTFHTDEGKDKVIEIQGGQVKDILNLLYKELTKFHDKLERKDNYITEIVKKSYNRNEENMKRLDENIRLITENSRQMGDLIHIIALQNEKIQQRADKLMDILDRKL
jgi:plasmid maintenance system antidote protein VapI